MPLALAHQTRIVPLSLSVWNRINPKGDPMTFDLNVYSSPMSLNECSCDGRILYSHKLYNEIGSSYADVYSHRFLSGKEFLQKFGPPGPYEMAQVRVSIHGNDLQFEVLQLNSEKVFYKESAPFDPEDDLIMQWAKPIRDQAFVDCILELGKGFEHHVEKQFQFMTVIELAPGIVFTLDREDQTPHVYVDLERFQNPDKALLKDMVYEIENGLMIIYAMKFTEYLSDRIVEDLMNRMLTVFIASIIDPSHHKDPATYLWQRRIDLLPQNW